MHSMQSLCLALTCMVVWIWPLAGEAELAQDGEAYFATIGEGFTAVSEGGNIEAAWRMFTTSDNVCEFVKTPARFVIAEDQIELVVGESFSFATLRVYAVDASHALSPRVPIVVEIEEKIPLLLNMDWYKAAPGGGVIAVRAGEFRLRIKGLCPEVPGHQPETVIRFLIREQP